MYMFNSSRLKKTSKPFVRLLNNYLQAKLKILSLYSYPLTFYTYVS